MIIYVEWNSNYDEVIYIYIFNLILYACSSIYSSALHAAVDRRLEWRLQRRHGTASRWPSSNAYAAGNAADVVGCAAISECFAISCFSDHSCSCFLEFYVLRFINYGFWRWFNAIWFIIYIRILLYDKNISFTICCVAILYTNTLVVIFFKKKIINYSLFVKKNTLKY